MKPTTWPARSRRSWLRPRWPVAAGAGQGSPAQQQAREGQRPQHGHVGLFCGVAAFLPLAKPGAVCRGQGRARKPRRSRANGPRAHERARPYQTYRHGLKALYARFGASMDVSKADYMIGVDMVRRGFKPEQIGQAIEQASPELPTRKAGHEADYVARTVKAVMASPKVASGSRSRPRKPSAATGARGTAAQAWACRAVLRRSHLSPTGEAGAVCRGQARRNATAYAGTV